MFMDDLLSNSLPNFWWIRKVFHCKATTNLSEPLRWSRSGFFVWNFVNEYINKRSSCSVYLLMTYSWLYLGSGRYTFSVLSISFSVIYNGVRWNRAQRLYEFWTFYFLRLEDENQGNVWLQLSLSAKQFLLVTKGSYWFCENELIVLWNTKLFFRGRIARLRWKEVLHCGELNVLVLVELPMLFYPINLSIASLFQWWYCRVVEYFLILF